MASSEGISPDFSCKEVGTALCQQKRQGKLDKDGISVSALIVVFVSIDGHLLAIATMLESYRILPVGLPVAPEILFSAGIRAAGSMFVAAAIIMLPVTMVMLMINVGVGVISRSAPTLNLFSFGFPITLMAVFILLYFSVGVLGNNAQDLVNNGLSNMQTLIGDLADG